MRETITTRRRFMVAATVLAGVSLSPAVLRQSRVWAQSGGRPGAAMISIARSLAPHDALSDDDYADVLNIALGAMAGSLDEQLDAAETALDGATGGDFMSADAEAQLAALTSIQDAAFFPGILWAVKTFLYSHPAGWRALGYEGPSWQQGGYMNRGAGEIDWLPETD
jgi:hypothetical protein